MRKKITQIEARRLRARVSELETLRSQERDQWAREYPGGVNLGQITLSTDSKFYGRLDASQMFGRVLVAKVDAQFLKLYSVP